ncbi:15416_t:CDS:2, partial [Racocetra fulgida]
CEFTPRTEQSQVPVPKGDLISFDENPLMHQPIETREPAVDPGIGSNSKQNIKEDFCRLSNKYYFIKTDLKKTTIEAYKKINEESEAIAEKTNRQVDMRKSENEKENALLNLALISALVFAEKYEREAIQYN